MHASPHVSGEYVTGLCHSSSSGIENVLNPPVAAGGAHKWHKGDSSGAAGQGGAVRDHGGGDGCVRAAVLEACGCRLPPRGQTTRLAARAGKFIWLPVQFGGLKVPDSTRH